MEGVNLCETGNCGKPAVSFEMRGTIKFRRCGEHLVSLQSKGMQIYDIDGYSFINSHSDAQVFEERKNLANKGRENLTVLIASNESEMTEALQTIDTVKANVLTSVEHRFEEMKAVAAGAYNETKNQFAELQLIFEKFLLSKESQLSYTASLLCTDLSLVPRFIRFGVADVSDHISAILSDGWMVSTEDIHSTLKCLDASQKQEAIESALAEALKYASKGIPEALRYADLLIEETAHNETQDQVVSKLLAWENERIEANLKWLKRSCDLGQRYGLPASTTVKVEQKLANLLCNQYSQFSNAEESLTHCYELVKAQNPLSEDAMSLCTDICGVYVSSEQFQRMESFGQSTLQTFEDLGHPPEHYWTIILYLVYSMKRLNKKIEVDTIFKYQEKIPVGNKLSEMLKHLTFGVYEYFYAWVGSAEENFLQARRIGISHFPTSIFTAITLSFLGLVCNENSGEHFFRQAQSIYKITSPMSISAAVNLTYYGKLFFDTNQFSKAKECYKLAQSIFELTSLQSIFAAINLSNMGKLFSKTEQLREAEECLSQAQSILEVAVLKSVEVANVFDCMGSTYGAMWLLDAAIRCYEEAENIFAMHGKTDCKARAESNADRCRSKQT